MPSASFAFSSCNQRVLPSLYSLAKGPFQKLLFFVLSLQGPLHYSNYVVIFERCWVVSDFSLNKMKYHKAKIEAFTIKPFNCSNCFEQKQWGSNVQPQWSKTLKQHSIRTAKTDGFYEKLFGNFLLLVHLLSLVFGTLTCKQIPVPLSSTKVRLRLCSH